MGAIYSDISSGFFERTRKATQWLDIGVKIIIKIRFTINMFDSKITSSL